MDSTGKSPSRIALRISRRRALATVGLAGIGAFAAAGSGAPSRTAAEPVPSSASAVQLLNPSPSDVAFQSTVWLQQLVGDVDVTLLAAGQAWVPRGVTGQENNIGYYPGQPTIAPPNQLWSGTSVPNPSVYTRTLLGWHYNVFGSDKARSFTAPDGNLLFLIGDIRGQTAPPYDVIAYSATQDPENPTPGSLDLTCYTSSKASSANQPQNVSDGSGGYTLLVYPNNNAGKANPLPNGDGNPLNLTFSVSDMGPNNAPYAGVTMPTMGTYVTLRFNNLTNPDGSTGWASVLTKFAFSPNPTQVLPDSAFTYLRVISQTPYTLLTNGQIVPGPSSPTNPCFVQSALHGYDSTYPSWADSNLLSSGSPNGVHLLAFGTGTFRGGLAWTDPSTGQNGVYDLSTIYLSAQPVVDVESSSGTMYFQGVQTNVVQWSAPDDANSLGSSKTCWPVLGGTPSAPQYLSIGDFSVACLLNQNPQVPELWLIMFDAHGTHGIQLFWSVTPWGPWTSASALGQPAIVFANSDGDGTGPSVTPNGAPFIQLPVSPTANPKPNGNGLSGPVIGPETNTLNASGVPVNASPFKVYGPMIVEKFCKITPIQGSSSLLLTVSWTLCTWIPYYAVLLKSVFTLNPGVPHQIYLPDVKVSK